MELTDYIKSATYYVRASDDNGPSAPEASYEEAVAAAAWKILQTRPAWIASAFFDQLMSTKGLGNFARLDEVEYNVEEGVLYSLKGQA